MAYDGPQPVSTGGKNRKEKPWNHPDRRWEVEDAMRTMMRAGEIVGDKKLMAEVKKCAADHAEKMHEVAAQASTLSKRGLISPRAMARMGK